MAESEYLHSRRVIGKIWGESLALTEIFPDAIFGTTVIELQEEKHGHNGKNIYCNNFHLW